jgi:hypothetical protein
MATISKQNTFSFASIGIDIGKEVFHLVGFDPDPNQTGRTIKWTTNKSFQKAAKKLKVV